MPKSKKSKKKSWPLWQKITFGSVTGLLGLCLVFCLWTILGHRGPDKTAQAALQSNAQVKVSRDSQKNLTCAPLTGDNNHQGIIFYAAALIDPAAYAPLCQLLAQNGYLVIMPKFNFNLSRTNPDIATQLIATHPEIVVWTGIGDAGGGVSLSDYAARHPAIFKNIILLSTTPKNPAFAQFPGRVASVTGSEDKILNQKKYQQTRSFLPKSAALVSIPGANHTQYGNYGTKFADGNATITSTEQQAALLETLQILTGFYPSPTEDTSPELNPTPAP